MARALLLIGFTSQPGGAELQLVQLARHLDPARYAPVVVLGADGPVAQSLRTSDIPVTIAPAFRYLVRGARAPLTAWRNLSAYIEAIAWLRRFAAVHGIEMVHAFVEPAVKYGAAIRLLSRCPAVCTFHDALQPPYGLAHRAALAAALGRGFDRTIVPSHASAQILRRAGVPAARITVIPNGVDAARFARLADGRHAARQRFGLADDDTVLAMAGRFTPVKGHDVLLRAVAALPHQSVRVLIVGGALFPEEAAWEREVDRQIGELGLASAVVRTGWLDDVAPVLAAADIVVHPCTGHDTLPAIVLEAMAAGKPVIASRAGGVPEIITDGHTGILVEPGDHRQLADAIATLAADPARRKALGAAARAHVEEAFSTGRHAAAVMKVYDEVRGGERTGGAGERSG